MASANRHFKRKKDLKLRKEIKKSMKMFEKTLRCIGCDRVPNVVQGEKIDDWYMNMESGTIQLTCPECRGPSDADE